IVTAGLVFALLHSISAQSTTDSQALIRQAVIDSNWQVALSEATKLRTSDSNAFNAGSYDYVIGRAAEKTGDLTLAAASYQSVVARNSPLSPYALWHLASLSRASGDLVHERDFLRRLTTLAPHSLFYDAAVIRLGQSFYEGGDYESAASSLRVATSAK